MEIQGQKQFKKNMEKKSIGAFWKKISANGKEYWSGNIEINNQKLLLVGFINERKKENKHPDIMIFETEKRSKNKESEKSILEKGIENSEVPII